MSFSIFSVYFRDLQSKGKALKIALPLLFREQNTKTPSVVPKICLMPTVTSKLPENYPTVTSELPVSYLCFSLFFAPLMCSNLNHTPMTTHICYSNHIFEDNMHYLKKLKIILWGKRVFIRFGVESKRKVIKEGIAKPIIFIL